MELVYKAAKASDMFEEANTELKREYLKKYVEQYNEIVSSVSGYKGSFGTGYPFYIFNDKMEGEIPVIEEQIRYNGDLVRSAHDHVINSMFEPKMFKQVWPCENCLILNGQEMKDLKIKCKKCPNIENELKPRKVINRLPDIDLWMVAEDDYEDVIMKKLIPLFEKYGMQTSDINPVKTINDVYEIAEQLLKEQMPDKFIPLDTHVVRYDKLYSLIESVPKEIARAYYEGDTPYLPILPFSLRKEWQNDDEAYNFIHDYLYSLTEYNFDHELIESLITTRKEIIRNYSISDLEKFVIMTGSDCVKRRQQEPTLKKRFNERMESWKKL